MISCILVCRARKDKEHKGKVIFIDAEQDVTRKNGQSFLEDFQIEKILNAYNNFVDIEGFAKVVSNAEIETAKSVLSISYYVEGITEEEEDFDESYQLSKNNSNSLNTEMSKLINMIKHGN